MNSKFYPQTIIKNNLEIIKLISSNNVNKEIANGQSYL